MSAAKGNCHNCGNSLSELEYGRKDSCSKCGSDTHVCLNCEFHDTSYNNECKETQADRVVDKDRSNFCDYFRACTTSGARGPSKDDLKAAAEALFKKK